LNLELLKMFPFFQSVWAKASIRSNSNAYLSCTLPKSESQGIRHSKST
jgi:hypothetical protein